VISFFNVLGLSYCGLALRHVSVDFKLYNFILGCVLYDVESQSASNIHMFVDEQLSLYGFGKICTHVRRTHRQIKLKRKLQLYSTRFNRAFYMLNVFDKVYVDVGGVINNNYMDYLSRIDKNLLEELCGFLVVFDQAIDQLSEEEQPTIHKVLPIRQLLLNHCEINSQDSSSLHELKIFLSERIKSAWILQNQHFISTLLHPSLKHFHKAPNGKYKALDLVKQEILKRTLASPIYDNTTSELATTTDSITFDTTTPSNSNNLLARCFDQPKPPSSSTSTPFDELDSYMALDQQINENDDVLLFWKENAKSFPILSLIVRDLYAIPASNTIVERLFSSSENTVTDQRTSLAANKLNKLLFLQKNLFILKQIEKDKFRKNPEQSKRRFSMSNDQLVILDEDTTNLIPSSTAKKTKTNDDFDSSSDNIVTIDSSKEPDNTLFGF
ncbi:unnamed protein product, partial [Didymodactylos carnosus]